MRPSTVAETHIYSWHCCRVEYKWYCYRANTITKLRTTETKTSLAGTFIKAGIILVLRERLHTHVMRKTRK